MKRYLMIGLFIFVFSFILNAQSKRNENTGWDESNLNGKVKSIKDQGYKAVLRAGIVIKKKRLIDVYLTNFDSLGNILNYSVYIKGKYLLENQTYVYDRYRNKTETNICFEKECEKWNYKYDENGNIIEESYNNNEPSKLKCNYKYDDKKNIIEETSYWIDDNERFNFKKKYLYNDSNSLIRKEEYGISGNQIVIFSTEFYDIKGRIFKIINDKYEPITINFYKYDENGNKTEDSTYISELFGNKKYYKYDENNNCVERCEYTTKRSLTKLQNKTNYNYIEFDKNKNWIKCVECFDNKIYMIREREIEYY